MCNLFPITLIRIYTEFMVELPPNIEQLYEKNHALLERLNFDPEKDDPLSLCNSSAYTNTGLFSEEKITAMFEGPIIRGSSSQDRIAKNIGMILVRPDMTHVSSEFETYVADRFNIIHIDTVSMDTESYWHIYKHDFYRLETMHCRLTRAALYIGSDCRLIAFMDKPDAPPRQLSDYVCRTLKGKQGIYQPDTIRGDTVYRNAIKLGAHKLDNSVDNRLKTAIDPFGAYRALAAVPTRDHVGLKYPLLFYTGVGAHVPDAAEINTDLPQLVADVASLSSQVGPIDA